MAIILLVDDDSSFLAALNRLLLRDGYLTRRATDATSALEEAGRGGSQIDLVIADLGLCQQGELQLLKELRQRKPAMPIIVLSASPDARSYLDALRLGIYEYLAKPLDFAELRQVVERALGPVAGGQREQTTAI